MQSSVVELRSVCKTYVTGNIETKALDSISLTVHAGEFVAIMGPSGSGKSTLMHILGALDKPSSGEYLLEDKNVAALTDDELADIRNQKIGFIFQAFNLLPRTSALKNVMLPMAYAGIPKDEREARATHYLESVGLSHRLHHTSGQLSGGQQQRVAIARGLAMNPAILLADEPTGNIASTQAAEIMKLFQDLNAKNHTIIMITHEPDIAKHAKRIITIKDGKLSSDKMNKQQRQAKVTLAQD